MSDQLPSKSSEDSGQIKQAVPSELDMDLSKAAVELVAGLVKKAHIVRFSDLAEWVRSICPDRWKGITPYLHGAWVTVGSFVPGLIMPTAAEVKACLEPTDCSMSAADHSSAIFDRWIRHPNGTHLYGYRLEGLGGFDESDLNWAGNGIYLASDASIAGAADATRHAFLPPLRTFEVDAMEPHYLENRDGILSQPVRRDDSPWLKACKGAFRRASHGDSEAWESGLAGDMLTTALLDQGYDSILVKGADYDRLVLLLRSKPWLYHRLRQDREIDNLLDIGGEIEANTEEAPKIATITQPVVVRINCRLHKVLWKDYEEWPCCSDRPKFSGLGYFFESVDLEFYFAQDLLDGEANPLWEFVEKVEEAESDTVRNPIARFSYRDFRFGTGRGETQLEFAELADVEVGPNILRFGTQTKKPHEFDFDVCGSDQIWYVFGEPVRGSVEHLFPKPTGFNPYDWEKCVREFEFIRRHTKHPGGASSQSIRQALLSSENGDYFEWILMLPDERLAQIGLLPWTLETIAEERVKRGIVSTSVDTPQPPTKEKESETMDESMCGRLSSLCPARGQGDTSFTSVGERWIGAITVALHGALEVGGERTLSGTKSTAGRQT